MSGDGDSDFLPQYAAQACASLEELGGFRGGANVRFSAYALGLASTIRSAVHLVLPDNGEVYRSLESKIPDYEISALAHLPAPICTFEYKCTETKRVVIAWSKRQLGLYESEDADDDEVAICDVRQATKQEYIASVRENLGDNFWVPDRSRLVVFTSRKPVQVRHEGENGALIECAIHPDLRTQEEADALLRDPREFADTFSRALFSVSQACVALQAGAALRERTEPSASRRWKMEKKGVGGFSYHIVDIPAHGAESPELLMGGTHASPRFHSRRAHVRKLPSGVLTFVKQCFVGEISRGTVAKHYNVRR